MTTWITRLFGGATAGKSANAGRTAADNPATIEDDSESGMRRQLIHVLLRDALRRHGINPAWIDCQILIVSSRSRGAGMYVRLVVRHWDESLVRYLVAFQKALQSDVLRFEPRASEWLHGISWQLEPENEFPYMVMPDKSFWQAATPAIVAKPAEPATNDARPVTVNATELAAAVRQANAARRAAPLPTMAAAPGSSLFPAFAATVPADQAEPKGQDNAGTAASKAVEDEASEAARDLEALFAIRDRELGMPGVPKLPQGGYEKTEPSPL